MVLGYAAECRMNVVRVVAADRAGCGVVGSLLSQRADPVGDLVGGRCGHVVEIRTERTRGVVRECRCSAGCSCASSHRDPGDVGGPPSNGQIGFVVCCRAAACVCEEFSGLGEVLGGVVWIPTKT